AGGARDVPNDVRGPVPCTEYGAVFCVPALTQKSNRRLGAHEVVVIAGVHSSDLSGVGAIESSNATLEVRGRGPARETVVTDVDVVAGPFDVGRTDIADLAAGRDRCPLPGLLGDEDDPLTEPK